MVTQPHDTAVCANATAAFSITAVNTVAYQWQENDGVGWYDLDESVSYIDGEHTAILSILNANMGLNSYQYRCVISDANASTDTSDAASLLVYDPPVISANPQNQHVCKNEIASFDISALNGTDYQWQENSGIGWLNLEDNSFYSGSTSANLDIYTTTGMNNFLYRCIVIHVSCPDTSLSAQLNVDPTPIVYSMTGGGTICEGSTGLEIGLDGSEIGVSYDLERDGVHTGIVMTGTGNSINFGVFNVSGSYSAHGYDNYTSCSVEMAGVATIQTNPLPLDFSAQGGGSICIGDEGKEIYLTGSEIGVSYELFLNGISTSHIILGTSYPISFGSFTEAGFYTIVASNIYTDCQQQLSGSAQIIVNPLPIANAGPDQTIIQGSVVQLSGSANSGSGNYSYLWTPSSLCANPINANTQSIPLYQTSLFFFEATDSETGCVSPTDTCIVFVGDGALYATAFSDQTEICESQTVNLLATASGGTGNYSYLWSSVPAGFSSTQANPSVNPTQNTIYTVEINDGVEVVSTSISIIVYPLPESFQIMGGGSYCKGGTGSDIYLNASTTAVSYQLYHLGSIVDEKTGTGQVLHFSPQPNAGEYSCWARTDFGCATLQNGTAQISIDPLPTADAGPNTSITSGQNANLSGSASGGSGSYVYFWSPSDSLLNPSASSPSTKPLYTTNVFHVYVQDEKLCESAVDEAIVFVNGGEVSLSIIASRTAICPGETVQLYALASGGSGSFTYQWQSNPSGFFSTIFNPSVEPSSSSWYVVSINDGLSVLTDSVFITVNPNPTAYSFTGGGSFCQGTAPDELMLSNSDIGIDYSLLLNGSSTGQVISGDGNALNFGTWNQNGSYSIYAMDTYTQCSNSMSGNPSVIIYDSPIVNAGYDQTIPTGTIASLSGIVSNGGSSYSYSWQPAYLCQTPSSQNTLTNPISQTTAFSLTATDMQSQCASLADTLVIYTSGGPLNAVATANQYMICSSEQVQLYAMGSGGTANYTYSWSSSPTGFYSGLRNPVCQPQTSTTYFLTIYDGISYAYASVFIQVNPVPATFNLSGGGSYCDGGSGVSIGLSGSENGNTYQLYLSPNQLVKEMTGTGGSLNFGSYTQQGSYYAVGQNTQGCSSDMSGESNVITHNLPIAQAGENQSIIIGGQTTLSGAATAGSGNYAYSWSPADSLLNPTNQNPATNPLHQTTIFELSVSDLSTSCQGGSTDQTVVFVTGGVLQLQTSSTSTAVCPGETLTLFALASGGSGNYSYLWQSNPAGFTSTLFDPMVQPQQTTVYTVSLTDGSNVLTSSITIEVNPAPQPFVLSGGGVVCEGDMTGNIILNGSEAQTTYELLHNNVSTSLSLQGNGFSLNFGNWTENGNYIAIASNNYTLCSNIMSGQASVVVKPLPVANAGPDKTILVGNNTNLSGSVAGGTSSYAYNWTPANLCINPQSQNSLTHPLNQTSLFTLEATDLQSQCSSEADTIIIYTTGGQLNALASSDEYLKCFGDPIQLLALGSGGNGNYSYEWTSAPAGFHSNLMNPIVQASVSTIYYLQVWDGMNYAYDSVSIQVIPHPSPFQITGGGAYCDGGSGQIIGLNGSESGSTYSLFREPGQLIQELVGDGQAISFGNYTEAGNYYATATKNELCHANMLGNAEISVLQIPLAQAGIDKHIQMGDQALLDGSGLGGSGSYLYNWSPADSLLNPNNGPALTKDLYATTLFELQVSDASTGCFGSSDQAVVFVSGGILHTQLLVSDPNICSGESTNLYALTTGGSGNYTYLWTSNPPGFTATTYDPVVNPSVTTIYTVLINDGNEIISDSISVQVFDSPTSFDLIGGGNYCEGGPGLELFLVSSELNVTYELFNLEGSTNIVAQGSGSSISFGYFQTESTYWVMATNNSGCTSEMNNTVIIEVDEIPTANAGADQFIEAGQSTILQGLANGGSGDYHYFWSPEYLLLDPNSQNPETEVLFESSIFSLYVTDNVSNCISSSSSTTVYITGGPLSISVLASPTISCENEQVQLNVLPSGGSGNFNYSWTSMPAGFYSSEQNPQAYPDVSSWFIVEVSDSDTIVFDSVYVAVNPLPEIYNVIGGGELCDGEDGKQIQLSNSEPTVLYELWYNQHTLLTEVVGDGSPVNFGFFDHSGTYTVYASYIDGNCGRPMAGSAIIIKHATPIADAGNHINIQFGQYTTINAQASGGSGSYLYQWTPSNKLINPTVLTPTTQLLNESTLFSLQLTDQNTNCLSEVSSMIVFVSGTATLSTEIIAQNTSSCPGEETALFVLPTGGSGAYNYYWQSRPEGFVSTSASIIVTPETSTWFVVTVTDGILITKDSVKISMQETPAIHKLLGGGGYCSDHSGVALYLDGSSLGESYALFNGMGPTGIIKTGTSSSVSFGDVSLTGSYFVQATNQNGCAAQMEGIVEVFINPKPQKFALIGGGVFCDNDQSQGIILSESEANVAYELFKDASPSGIVRMGTGLPLSFSGITENGIYTAVATNTISSCFNTMNGAIEMIIKASPDLIVEGDSLICQGETTTLTASGSDTYVWNTIPPTYDHQITITPEESTYYELFAENFNGCAASKTVEVNVFSRPSISLDNETENYQLICYPGDLSNYTFSVGESILQSGASNKLFYGDLALSSDSVTVVAENEAGCFDISTAFVSFSEPPNAFTPNGDGKNEVFLKGKEIRVYSRWGKELYHGTAGWDGTHNGQMVAPGTYYYIHEIYNTEGALVKTLKGSVTLVIK